MTSLADVDLAAVSPCPRCGEPVRRFPSVPIAGNGLDGIPSGPWVCAACIRRAVAETVTPPVDNRGAA